MATWMYVQTSAGSFLYKIHGTEADVVAYFFSPVLLSFVGARTSGRGILNSYGVTSFQNIKVPPGVMFQRSITITNPHADMLQVQSTF